jgi:hypothetical protein
MVDWTDATFVADTELQYADVDQLSRQQLVQTLL